MSNWVNIFTDLAKFRVGIQVFDKYQACPVPLTLCVTLRWCTIIFIQTNQERKPRNAKTSKHKPKYQEALSESESEKSVERKSSDDDWEPEEQVNLRFVAVN